jgi:hypothetical protein
MRMFNKVLSASVLVLTMVAAGPADAKAPERGDQVMVLNQDPATGEFGLFGCPGISWFGTVELAGTTYGMALYPLPGRFTGQDDMVFHYQEAWKVWSGLFTLTGGILQNCEPGEVVLSGLDVGTGILANAKFRSNGTVDEAHAPFADWLGRRVHQDGIIGPIDYQGLPLFGFYGDLRLN